MEQVPGVQYTVVVRFEKVNYAGISTNNYAVDELEEVYFEVLKCRRLIICTLLVFLW